MNDEAEEILNEFIQESRDHLAGIEPDFLELERQGERASREVSNRIFRAIHSIKGGAAFLAFDALKRFSHAMEGVLMLLRDGQLAPTSTVVDLLLRGVDVLRAMLDDVGHSDQVPFVAELNELNSLLTGPTPPALNTPTTPGSESQSQDEALDESILHKVSVTGQILYRLAVPKGELEQVGGIDALLRAIDAVGQRFRTIRNRSEAEQLVVICSSVLEPDLFASATKLPLSAITRVPLLGQAIASPPEAAQEISREAPTDRNVQGVAFPQPCQVQSVPESVFIDPTVLHASASPDAQDSLRVKVELLSRLMNVAGELVLGRNQLLRSLRGYADVIPGLLAILQHVDRVTTELQESIMQTRMQPISMLFARYRRVVRDMARQLGKRIELETTGNEVELDKSIIEALADPLTHIIRNAIDHGIERPDERARQGKPAAGRIKIAAFHESGQVYIVVSDDGQGIDRAKVRKKAVDKRFVSQSEVSSMSDREILNLILMPGFSTAEQVTDLSGRGVGMDVVRTNVERLGGHVELDSTEGKETVVRLRLPLTLAIIPSLVVRVGSARYAVPQVNIVELVWIRAADVAERLERVQGAPVMRLRGKLLPLVHLAEVMGFDEGGVIKPERTGVSAKKTDDEALPEISGPDLSIVVLRAGDIQFGVLVDELFEWEEIVVKPMPTHLMDLKAYAGTTILGDGQVIMILDPGGLATLAELSACSSVNEENRRAASEATDAELRSVILFSSAPGELFAMPQERVLRLERIEPNQLERIGGHDYVKYRGQGLPVLRMESVYPVSPVPTDAEELYLIIPRERGAARSAEPCGGILVWKILDALDVNVTLARPMFTGPGITGSAVLDGSLTMFMDPSELLGHFLTKEGST